MAAVTICSDFGAQKNSLTVSTVSPSISHEVMGLDAMNIIYKNNFSKNQQQCAKLWKKKQVTKYRMQIIINIYDDKLNNN